MLFKIQNYKWYTKIGLEKKKKNKPVGKLSNTTINLISLSYFTIFLFNLYLIFFLNLYFISVFVGISINALSPTKYI